VTDIASWITYLADGATRNSSRSVLYSRFGDADLLRADGLDILLAGVLRQFSVQRKRAWVWM